MSKIFIARDGDGALFYYRQIPVWNESGSTFDVKSLYNFVASLDDSEYPEIKKGECFAAELVLKEKVEVK